MSKITESDIELFIIEELERLGYQFLYGPDISLDGLFKERQSYSDIILAARLRTAIKRLNPNMPADAQEQALRAVQRISSPDLLADNEAFHRFLTDGVPVQYRLNGDEKGDYAWLIDFENPLNNEFIAVNQYTVIENNQNKRPDILLFANGIPLVVIELKNPVDENATINKAYDQIQTYKATIPSLFTFNAFCVISDGLECRGGSVSAGFNRYMTWKSSDGNTEASHFAPELETLAKGMLTPATLLDLVRNFIVFEKTISSKPSPQPSPSGRGSEGEGGIIQVETEKKVAAYHQYFAVNKAIGSTIKASGKDGNKKGGVVWHTQGSGKSLSMVFYAGKLITSPDMQNPTIVVITDGNDLDDQLFNTFASSKQLLRQEPVQAKDRDHLKELLKVASGGIVFTTIQKFLPDEGKAEYDQLSDRTNIVVIADEAHRTQYGFEAKLIDTKDKETKEVIGKRIAYGFAKYMREEVLGDEKLRIIAIEVAEKVKANASIDWTIRESARAKLMVLVKRTLTKYGYPPDMQQQAVDTVLKQAELLAEYFVSGETHAGNN